MNPTIRVRFIEQILTHCASTPGTLTSEQRGVRSSSPDPRAEQSFFEPMRYSSSSLDPLSLIRVTYFVSSTGPIEIGNPTHVPYKKSPVVACSNRTLLSETTRHFRLHLYETYGYSVTELTSGIRVRYHSQYHISTLHIPKIITNETHKM
jgi:hypothetical protein